MFPHSRVVHASTHRYRCPSPPPQLTPGLDLLVSICELDFPTPQQPPKPASELGVAGDVGEGGHHGDTDLPSARGVPEGGAAAAGAKPGHQGGGPLHKDGSSDESVAPAPPEAGAMEEGPAGTAEEPFELLDEDSPQIHQKVGIGACCV